MRKPRELSVLIPLVGLVVALALVLPSASASTPAKVEVSAVNTDGSLDLKVSGTVIDVPGTGNFGNLTGTAEFKDANGVETILNIDRSEMRGAEGTFLMTQLTDTRKLGTAIPPRSKSGSCQRHRKTVDPISG